MWRRESTALGPPSVATPADIDGINRVFADAFTERYHRDGMALVRVPELNAAVWRYALGVAGLVALIWRDEAGDVAAFNMVHTSGTEGWMGPLAVRPDCQGRGLGRTIVSAGIDLLRRHRCRVIGLETMPRTIDNIGFYSRLGFRPGHLTISVVRDLVPADRTRARRGSDDALTAPDRCRALVDLVAPGLDFTREMALTHELGLGGVTGVADGGALGAFALWHSAPLADGRSTEELRVLKVVAPNLDRFLDLVGEVVGRAAALGFRRVSVRCQTAYRGAYAGLLAAGFRVHWTDLRMSLTGFEEPAAGEAVIFSNWEI